MALKRATLLLFTCIYSLAAVGMPVHYHFCKGELEKVSVFNQATCGEYKAMDAKAACCSPMTRAHCTGADQQIPCCQSEAGLLQIDEQVAAVQPDWTDVTSPEITEGFAFTDAESDDTLPASGLREAPPPAERYLLYQALLFYG